MGKGYAAMRKQEWPAILDQKIEEFKIAPFVWGECDCLQFVGIVAGCMVDYDLHAKAKYWDYRYSSEEGALKMLADHFDGQMGNVFGTVFEEINPKMAGRGDIAVIEVLGKEICGVIDSSGRNVACKSVEGVLFAPVSKIRKAWRVD